MEAKTDSGANSDKNKTNPVTNENKEVAQMVQKNLSAEEEKLLKLIAKGTISLKYLSESLNQSTDAVVKLIDDLRLKGFDIILKRKVEKDNKDIAYEVSLVREGQSGGTIVLDKFDRKEIKILVIAETGLGLRSHQPKLVATALQKGVEEKVDFAIHAGNITAGKPTASNQRDFLSGDFNEQVEFAKKMPKVPFNIYFLNGPRDLTHKKKGQNPARALCQERPDLRYEGDLETNFIIKGLKIKVLHVNDTALYTKSYALQGVAENFQEAVDYVFRKTRRPDLLLVGGIYAWLHIPAKRKGGMEVIGLPSLHAMTSTQKIRNRRGGSPELGYIIVTIKLDGQGNPTEINHTVYLLTAYQQADDYLDSSDEEIDSSQPLTEEQKRTLSELKEIPKRYGELSRNLNFSKAYVKTLVDGLIKLGYNIVYDPASAKLILSYDWKERKFEPIPSDKMFVKTIKTANIADSHIGNRDARTELIPEAYKIAEREKVDIMTHSGDFSDGQNAYPGHEMELIQHGADAQLEKALEIWPESKIPTVIITGSSHEWVYWTKSGYNIVRMFANLKKNVEYIGGTVGLEGVKMVKGVLLKLVHPKGGIPYGKSYRLQRFIESLMEEIDDVDEGVRLLLVGHLHVAMAMVYKGIVSLLVPGLEAQTWYLKGKGLNPWLGMWIIELALDSHNNVTRITPKYISFEKNGDKK